LNTELQVEPIVEPELKLLIQWSSRWDEFRTSIWPAMERSPRPLAGEARTGLVPYQKMLLVCGGELALLLILIFLPDKLAKMRAKLPAAPPKYDVLYFSADELPRTEDNGGASAGKSGHAGGLHAFHRSQAIRVARGEVLREKVLDAPRLNLPKSDSAVANLLAYKAAVPGPAPTEGLRSSRSTASLPFTAIAPAPGVQNNSQRTTMLTAPNLNALVVPPAPKANQRDLQSLRLLGSHEIQVVPPPVSAPERVSNSTPRLTLPAPAVVAPPPSEFTRDLARAGPGYGPGEFRPQIIPPPVQMESRSTDTHKISGLGDSAVVPPTVSVNGPTASGHKVGDWNSGSPVAPPVQVAGGSLNGRGVSHLGSSNSVVPPPPSLAGGSALGSGRGARGEGLGGAFNAGSVSAPANSGGTGRSTGVVISQQPGSTAAVPNNAGTGALALSPTGGAKPGLGGTGGGSGIDYGAGTGSGTSGDSSGASKSAAGHGADMIARNGISPYPGKGGAGSGTVGTPAMPGVSVHGGGSNIVTLPSFSSNSSAPTVPGLTSDKDHTSGGITVVATSRSGGAFNRYGQLKGQNYTIYLQTTMGTAVMQFADPETQDHPYTNALSSPRPLRTELPPHVQSQRLVVSGVLDRAGLIKNPKVLETGTAQFTADMLASISHWKFSPAMHGQQAVEVNIILGFGIDTN
jgi:hypothetical protein